MILTKQEWMSLLSSISSSHVITDQNAADLWDTLHAVREEAEWWAKWASPERSLLQMKERLDQHRAAAEAQEGKK